MTTTPVTYRLRVYKIQILKCRSSNIWYASKKGMEFFTYPSVKENSQGYIVPCLRICEYDEDTNQVYVKPADLDIYFEDVAIIGSYLVTATSMKHIRRGEKM